MKSSITGRAAAALLALAATAAVGAPADDARDSVKNAVDAAVLPLMARHRVPGMAVAVIVAGRSYVFDYGVASMATRDPVGPSTLFEIGSVTKTFTAMLATYAQQEGHLSLADKVGKYLLSQRNSRFGEVRLLDLGTHTAGGFPLQVPASVRDNDQLMRYFSEWRPAYARGTHRTYANPSIGALGMIAASSMGRDFAALMEGRVFPALGMRSSFIHVPEARMADYAQGYTGDDVAVRMTPGVLSSEAYGIKTTAADLIRFVQGNMNLIPVERRFQQAIDDTHVGYFQVGAMTQDLIWEQYSYPVALAQLLEGNSPDMIFKAKPVTEIKPPQAAREDVWINKTGSTNGFAAYVAFVPMKRLGIVMLANKNVPIDERVSAAYEILTSLGEGRR